MYQKLKCNKFYIYSEISIVTKNKLIKKTLSKKRNGNISPDKKRNDKVTVFTYSLIDSTSQSTVLSNMGERTLEFKTLPENCADRSENKYLGLREYLPILQILQNQKILLTSSREKLNEI